MMNEPNSIRVAIVGDHPWTGHSGTIEPTHHGRYLVTRVLGGPEMLRVKLESGHECYAEKKHLELIEPPGATDKVFERGTVYRDGSGRKRVLRKARKLEADEEFVCAQPHDDGDFSYFCWSEWCRCMQ